MSSTIPIDYYNDPVSNSYVYESLEMMVNNFLGNYTGYDTKLGEVPRTKVLYHFKKGIQSFTINALQETRAVELTLGDSLDVILPPDYVSYVKIYWVNEINGQLMLLANNKEAPMGTSFMQDQQAEILFDNNGYVVEGTTMHDALTDDPKNNENYQLNNNSDINSIAILGCGVSCSGCQYYASGCVSPTLWGLDTSKNRNGSFHIDTRQGRIHFSSDNVSRVIMLIYVSDGLQYSNEADIKVNKMVEDALYNYVNYQLMSHKQGIQMYEIAEAKKMYHATLRNAKIAMMNLRSSDVFRLLNKHHIWLK
jgi:hypothetical protein